MQQEQHTWWTNLDISWVGPVVLFYVQNVDLVYSAVGQWPSALERAILTVTTLRFTAGSSSASPSSASMPFWEKACAVPNLTAPGKIAISLLIPLCIAAGLAVWYLAALGMQSVLRPLWVASSPFWYRSLRVAYRAKRRCLPSSMRLLLVFYTSIVSTIGSLLHCVPVNGEQDMQVVFRAGGVRCYSVWQILLWLVFGAIVVPFPAVIFLLQVWVRRRINQQKRRGRVDVVGGEEDGRTERLDTGTTRFEVDYGDSDDDDDDDDGDGDMRVWHQGAVRVSGDMLRASLLDEEGQMAVG